MAEKYRTSVDKGHESKRKPQTNDYGTAKLKALLASIILHELAHRILIWWSRGYCDTPECQPYSAQAGCYIEKCFFGGVVEGQWEGKTRSPEKLKGIIIVSSTRKVTIGA